MTPTLYMVLDVPADADHATITTAYARLCMDDTYPNVDHSTLTYAYLVLSDAGRRAAYDFALRRTSEEYLGYEVAYDITITPSEAHDGTTRALSFHRGRIFWPRTCWPAFRRPKRPPPRFMRLPGRHG